MKNLFHSTKVNICHTCMEVSNAGLSLNPPCVQFLALLCKIVAFTYNGIYNKTNLNYKGGKLIM